MNHSTLFCIVVVAALTVVATAEVIDTGDKGLYNHIGGNSPVLLLFFVETDCIECSRYHEALELVDKRLQQRTRNSEVVVAQVDFLRNPHTETIFRKLVSRLPSLVFFPAGSTVPTEEFVPINRDTGVSAAQIEAWLDQQLARHPASPKPATITLAKRAGIRTGNPNLHGLAIWQTVVLLLLAAIGIAAVVLFLKAAPPRSPHRRHVSVD